MLGLTHENRRETKLVTRLVPEDSELPSYQLQLSFEPSEPSGPVLTLEGSVGMTVSGGEVDLRSAAIELYSVAGGRKTFLGRVVLGDGPGPVPVISGGKIVYVQTEKAGLEGDLITGGVSHFSRARLSLAEGDHVIEWRVSFSSTQSYPSYEMRPSFTIVGATPGPRSLYGSVVGKLVDGVPRVSASTVMRFEAWPVAVRGDRIALRVPVELGYGSSVFASGGLYEVLDVTSGAFRALNLTGPPGETVGVTVITEPYPLNPLTTPERCTYEISSSNPEFGSLTIPRHQYYQDPSIISTMELASLGADFPVMGGVGEGWVCTFTRFDRLRKFLRRPPGAFVVSDDLLRAVPLDCNLTNPAQCKGWMYATELMTLNLNLFMQNRMLLVTPNSLGAFMYEGTYVADIALAANAWIGTGVGEAVPYELLKSINESFVGGRASRWALEHLLP